MKSLFFLTIGIFAAGCIIAQEKFVVPQLTNEQKSEVLYNHVIAYAITGISFAKSQGVSPEDYGKFMGKEFITMWNPAGGFPVLVNRLLFILAGMHPDNQMQIVRQDDKSITFKLKNVDLPFKDGSMFDVTYQDLMDCSHGIISTLAEHMNSDFSQEMTDDGWYVVKLSSKV